MAEVAPVTLVTLAKSNFVCFIYNYYYSLLNLIDINNDRNGVKKQRITSSAIGGFVFPFRANPFPYVKFPIARKYKYPYR